MTIEPNAIISGFDASVETAQTLMVPGHELHTSLVEDGQKIDFPVDAIETVAPGEEPGTFVMRLKQEVVDNRGKIMVITGASLLALGGLIVQKRRSHKE